MQLDRRLPPAPLQRALAAWAVLLVVVGGAAAVGRQGDDGVSAGRAAPARASTTTTTLPPEQPLIGRPSVVDGAVQLHAATVDANGLPVASSLPASPTRGDGPGGRRVVVEDSSTTSPVRTTCGFAGCQTGSSTTLAAGLAVFDAAGHRTELTSGGYDRDPEWSPKGDVIAYISHRAKADGSGEHDVAALVTAGGVPRGTLTPEGVDDTSVTFSPDGDSVAVYRRPVQQYGDGTVVVIDLFSRAERTIATGRFSELTWSPDGASIAAIGERLNTQYPQEYPNGFPVARDLWLLHADGTPPIRLTDVDPDLGLQSNASFCGSSGGYFPTTKSPTWSRDGRLAYLTNELHLERFGRISDVAIADLTGGGANQVLFHAPPDTCVGGQNVSGEYVQLLGWA